MEKQLNFTDMEYSKRRRTTKREECLNRMDQLLPWVQWVEVIRPYYPLGKRGRPPPGESLQRQARGDLRAGQ